MTFALVDLIIILIVAGFVFFGLFFGFVHALGALVGTLAGAFIAGRTYEVVAQAVHSGIPTSLNVQRVVAFILIFTLVNRAIGLLFWFAEKALNFLSFIPFLKTINRLAGAAFGFLEGALVLGLTLHVAARYPFWIIPQFLAQSKFSAFFQNIADILVPLLPKALTYIR